jgi:hypothetical protein
MTHRKKELSPAISHSLIKPTMSKLIEAIEAAIKSNKSYNHLSITLELNAAGNPASIFVNFDGNLMTRLGMIDVLIRQLEDIREELHEELQNDSEETKRHRSDADSVIKEKTNALRQKIESLPEEFRDPVNALLNKMDKELGKHRKEDVATDEIKAAFVKSILSQINKRFGFEGNSIPINP